MDEPRLVQKLVAEVIGTAFLVFVGVGSVPATLIVSGDAPFTMADLGMISFAFATIVVATVYALGHISGHHINPAVTLALAVSGKFPWSRVPVYLVAQLLGASIGASAILGVLGSTASDVGPGVVAYGVGAGQAFVTEFVRYLHAGVHGVRRRPPQGGRRLRRARHRSGARAGGLNGEAR